MENIFSYLKWYSDFDFQEKPFTDVDNLIFSYLSYAHYDSSSEDKSIRECLIQNPDHISRFYEAAKRSKRYGNVTVSFIADEYSEINDRSTQFYALCYTYLPHKHYVAFRGTDASLAGWKEDLMMGYQLTPAQKNAAIYLEYVLMPGESYYVGGHSKGGNLALFACCNLSDDKRQLVDHIYINDGPGLNPDVCDVSLIEHIKDKITIIEPEFSIFGKLYEPKVEDIRIVKSFQSGLLQHSVRTWGVEFGELVYSDHNDDTSEWINQVVHNWINNESEASRKIFVDELFETLTANGAKTRFEIKPDGLTELKHYWKVLSTTDSQAVATAARLPLSVIFGNFFKAVNTGHILKAVRGSVTIQGILVMILGLGMLLLPKRFFDIAFFVLLFALVIMQVVHTVTRLIQSKWNLKRQRPLVIISLASLSILTILLVKEGAMFIVESVISGFILLVWAYRNLSHAKDCEQHNFEYWKNILEAVFTSLYGIAILVAPGALIKWYTITLGVFLTIDGLLTAITGQN